MAAHTRHRRSAMLMLAACALAPGLAAASERDPAAIVAAIYRRAAAGQGDSGGNFVWSEGAARRTYFTARTAALWQRAERATPAGDMGPVGFDPVTSSQDPNLKSFDARVEEEGPERTHMLVSLTGHGEPRPYAVLRYVFLRENGRWLIDDIATAQGGTADSWSVRKLLDAHIGSNRRGR
jgi:hypothetical protein